MTIFYLDQLQDVESESDVTLILSPSTVALCIHALIPAEERENWIQDLQPLDDAEWAEAEAFLWRAIRQLSEGTMRLQWVVHLSGVQTVYGGTDALYELDTAEYDPDGQFDVVNHQWVVPADGLYLLGGFVQFWGLPNSGDVWARIRTQTNGDYHLTSGNAFGSDQNYVHAEFELPARLTAGDVVEFFVAHSNTSVNEGTADYNKTQRAWCYKL